MPPPPWATGEKQEFLESRLSEYRQLQQQKQYTHFWARLFEDWFKQWPEGSLLFPDKPKGEPLTEKENEQLGAAMKMRRGQLQTWYRYRASVTKNKRAAMTSKKITTVEPRTRLPTKEEVFSSLYYEELIKPTVMARIKDEDATTPGQKLSIIRSVRKEVFESLSEEMLAEVDDVLAQKTAEKENRKKNEGDLTPEDYKVAIEECPAVLRQFFTALAARTGWSFTILMGGPDPRKNGDITSCSFHIGENGIGNSFNDAHPTFSETFMSPYTDFLETVYPKDIRQMRTQKVKVEAHNEDDGSKTTDGADNGPDVSELDDVSKKQIGDSSGLHDISEGDREPESDVLDKRHDISAGQASTGTKITCDTSDGGVDGITIGNDLSPNSVTNELSGSVHLLNSGGGRDDGTTEALTHGQMTTSAPSQTGLLPAAFTTGGFQMDELSDELSWSSDRGYSTNGSLYPNMFTGAPGRFDVTSIGTGTLGGMNDLGMEGNWMFGDSGGWMTNKQNLTFWDMLNGPDDWLDDPALGIGIPPKAGNQGSGYTAPSLLPLSPNSPDLPPGERGPVAGESEGGIQGADGQGQYSPPGPLPSSHSIPEVQPISTETVGLRTQDNSTGQPVTLAPPAKESRVPGERSSRSGRTIIPSTRMEKMNEIGSNSKENIPPAPSRPSSEWVPPAKEYLLQLNLGEEWKSCVNAWLELEESLDYGAKTKGTLPLSKQRPEEWSKWTSKFRNGTRQYQFSPPINDVELFGITCMKWWHRIQPHFRQNGGELLPLPNLVQTEASDGDPWVNLRKGGPNGLIAIILLLSWWGKHAIPGTDTANQWRDTTADVQRVLQTMTRSSLSSKRAASGDILVPSKRRRIQSN